ncbi:MAG: ATP-binding protein [Chloracidobacterium sp.]|uniref:ATP-binding protein n=1 Tax=Chloracidobacterium validum TaxID=2821543 RepID=A0ABX8B9M8_9BACT|nr:ATP-binding protein [Chloracidobacterium validum]QUW02353.1 ATP-binding protein [Chloracidobacterium validum]
MSANVPKRVELEIPIAHDKELEATKIAEQLAAELEFGPDCVAEIKLALVEGIINAFEHSGSAIQKVFVEFTIHDEELEVIVQDFGQGFDAANKPNVRPLQKRGYGRMLMESLMDEVNYFTSPQGTRLVMKKRRPPKCA